MLCNNISTKCSLIGYQAYKVARKMNDRIKNNATPFPKLIMTAIDETVSNSNPNQMQQHLKVKEYSPPT